MREGRTRAGVWVRAPPPARAPMHFARVGTVDWHEVLRVHANYSTGTEASTHTPPRHKTQPVPLTRNRAHGPVLLATLGDTHTIGMAAFCDSASETDGRWVPPPAWARSPPYVLPQNISEIIGMPRRPNGSDAGICWRPEERALNYRSTNESTNLDNYHRRIRAGRRAPLDLVWSPLRCRFKHTLRPPKTRPADALSDVCAAIPGHVSIVVVGDSVTSQLFLSLAYLLGAHLGLNGHSTELATGAITDLTAAACGGRVRLNFVRSDLLLWSNTGWEHNRVKACERGYVGNSFLQRAKLASVVVLHLGHHAASTVDLAQKAQDAAVARAKEASNAAYQSLMNHAAECGCLARQRGRREREWWQRHINPASARLSSCRGSNASGSDITPGGMTNCSHLLGLESAWHQATKRLAVREWQIHARLEAFAPRNLDRTLTQLVSARDALGYRRASVLVLGPTAPVPGCSRFREPLEMSSAVLAFAEPDGEDALTTARRTSPFAPRWRAMRSLNEAAAVLTRSHGARYLDVTTMTMTRPDGAIGPIGTIGEDCLHFCIPGPLDSVAELIYNALEAELDLAIGPTEVLAGRPGSEAAAPASNSKAASSAFFKLPLATWLTARGAGRHIETLCDEGAPPHSKREAACDKPIAASKVWWWPFPKAHGDECGCSQRCVPQLILKASAGKPLQLIES